MTVFNLPINEFLFLQESVRKNLHSETVAEHLLIVEPPPTTQHKFLDIIERLDLIEQAQREGTIFDRTINQTLIFNQSTLPRVSAMDVYDLLLFVEELNNDNIVDRLVLIETAVADKAIAIFEVLALVETLGLSVSLNLPINEALVINEGLSGYLINEDTGNFHGFNEPFCDPDQPLISGIPVQEVPTGIVDSVNTIFTLSFLPVSNEAVEVFINGLLQQQTIDYNIVGVTITFLAGSTPQTGDSIVAYYLRP